MRKRWILDRNTGKLVTPDQFYREKAEGGPMVIGDITEPFVSQADGKTVIHTRRQYRDHLRAHGMVEIGNEPLRAKKPEAPSPAPILRDIYNNRHSPDALRNIAESGKIRN